MGQERTCHAARGCHLPPSPELPPWRARTIPCHPLLTGFGVKGTFAGFLRITFLTSEEQGGLENPAQQGSFFPQAARMDPLPSWVQLAKALFFSAGPGLLIAEADRRSQILLFLPSISGTEVKKRLKLVCNAYASADPHSCSV